MKTIEQISEEIKNRYPETPQAAYESAKLAAEQQLSQDISIVSNVLIENGYSQDFINFIIDVMSCKITN